MSISTPYGVSESIMYFFVDVVAEEGGEGREVEY